MLQYPQNTRGGGEIPPSPVTGSVPSPVRGRALPPRQDRGSHPQTTWTRHGDIPPTGFALDGMPLAVTQEDLFVFNDSKIITALYKKAFFNGKVNGTVFIKVPEIIFSQRNEKKIAHSPSVLNYYRNLFVWSKEYVCTASRLPN